eukprot:15479716-Alexandrium_andersonii.AAC.1
MSSKSFVPATSSATSEACPELGERPERPAFSDLPHVQSFPSQSVDTTQSHSQLANSIMVDDRLVEGLGIAARMRLPFLPGRNTTNVHGGRVDDILIEGYGTAMQMGNLYVSPRVFEGRREFREGEGNQSQSVAVRCMDMDTAGESLLSMILVTGMLTEMDVRACAVSYTHLTLPTICSV